MYRYWLLKSKRVKEPKNLKFYLNQFNPVLTQLIRAVRNRKFYQILKIKFIYILLKSG